jgi:hypothetical protein
MFAYSENELSQNPVMFPATLSHETILHSLLPLDLA